MDAGRTARSRSLRKLLISCWGWRDGIGCLRWWYCLAWVVFRPTGLCASIRPQRSQSGAASLLQFSPNRWIARASHWLECGYSQASSQACSRVIPLDNTYLPLTTDNSWSKKWGRNDRSWWVSERSYFPRYDKEHC
jgi:hypothetical protein